MLSRQVELLCDDFLDVGGPHHSFFSLHFPETSVSLLSRYFTEAAGM